MLKPFGILTCVSALLIGGMLPDSSAAEGSALRAAAPRWVDLSHAVIAIESPPEPIHRKAAQMLSEEAAKRSGVTLKIVSSTAATGRVPVIRLAVDGTASRKPPGRSPSARSHAALPGGFLLTVEPGARAPQV